MFFDKKIIKFIVLSVFFVVMLTLCGCSTHTSMPFNGQIDFHNISITIPEKYVRDSTQSSNDLWVFEHGFYSEYIIISRSDISGDTTASIEGYVNYMKQQGAVSDVTTFLEKEAVHSTYVKDEVYCQEMLFAYGGSFYAIALRGGNEEDFQSLLYTVKISDLTSHQNTII